LKYLRTVSGGGKLDAQNCAPASLRIPDMTTAKGASMSWGVYDHELPAMQDLKKASDRAVAIIAGSLVEARVRTALEETFHRNASIENEMFRSSGPLGSFSAKIKLAFLVGIISKEAYKELETLKDIRNRFAHYLDIKDFKSERICVWCNNLKLIEKYFQEAKPHTDLPNPHNLHLVMGINGKRRKLRSPKWRYMMTAMLLSRALMTPTGRQPRI
jgi:DNA-binding MltR family transcriptional regulator